VQRQRIKEVKKERCEDAKIIPSAKRQSSRGADEKRSS
jgi:hypothetical protein